MEELELLRYDLIREYKKCLESVECSKNHIEIKLANIDKRKSPRSRDNIESIKKSRDVINKNEKKLIDIRRKYYRYFGNLEEISSLEARDESNKKLIIRLDI